MDINNMIKPSTNIISLKKKLVSGVNIPAIAKVRILHNTPQINSFKVIFTDVFFMKFTSLENEFLLNYKSLI